jgi:hypothetical protein
MTNQKKRRIRSLVKTAYDLQDMRTRVGGRLVQQFRSKMGLENDESDEEDVLRDLKHRFKRVTDGIALEKLSRRRTYEYDGVITDYGELLLINHYLKLTSQEKSLFRDLGKEIAEVDIWKVFFEDVNGVGPAMAGVMISEFDPHKGKYVSSFWKYAGLDVADDGKARSRREEHLRTIEYEDSEGNTKTRKGLTFNPFLHDKLLGVLGPCLLRAGGEYKDTYDDYKHRIEQEGKGSSDGHRHRMAIRYMVKMLVKDLYLAWRPLEGLPVHDPYAEDKLDGEPHGDS